MKLPILSGSPLLIIAVSIVCSSFQELPAQKTDPIAKLQSKAVETKQAVWGHWGPNREVYSSWKTHTNRLTPIYTFGLDLKSVAGENSIYRSGEKLEQLYGYLPSGTLNDQADYFDQTDVYRLQKSAIDSGKKKVVLFVFDGMDWETTRAAAIAKVGKVTYQSGRGAGLHFLDYRGIQTDYGFFVTSPHSDGAKVDVNRQTVSRPGSVRGGYDFQLGGSTPWQSAKDNDYLISKSKKAPHAYTDSASSATSMTSGLKTYNSAINVDPLGRQVTPLARRLQADGFAIGAVTSVPISHATPACAYANNVHRNDYQDLTRDLIGRPSIAHPESLPGLDVLIGCGWGVDKEKDGAQGKNYVPGNRYITAADLENIDISHGGKYVVAQRTDGKAGGDILREAAGKAKGTKSRLFGFFGVKGGHLPYQTANGDYIPVASPGNPSAVQAESYTSADLRENVTLSQMSTAALEVLDSRSDRWWLMIEAGDVDWANHANNIDNSIGAVFSGDEAFHAVVSWIEKNGGWKDTAVILTADHGHYLVLSRPDILARGN